MSLSKVALVLEFAEHHDQCLDDSIDGVLKDLDVRQKKMKREGESEEGRRVDEEKE